MQLAAAVMQLRSGRDADSRAPRRLGRRRSHLAGVFSPGRVGAASTVGALDRSASGVAKSVWEPLLPMAVTAIASGSRRLVAWSRAGAGRGGAGGSGSPRQLVPPLHCSR